MQGEQGWVSRYTLLTPLTPFSGGCKPSVYRGFDTLTPLNQKFPMQNERITGPCSHGDSPSVSISVSQTICLIQQHQSGDGRIDNHADGIDLHPIGADEGGGEEEDADAELPGIFSKGTEIVLGHQHQGGGS